MTNYTFRSSFHHLSSQNHNAVEVCRDFNEAGCYPISSDHFNLSDSDKKHFVERRKVIALLDLYIYI